MDTVGSGCICRFAASLFLQFVERELYERPTDSILLSRWDMQDSEKLIN